MAVDERGELRLRHRTHFRCLDRAALEQHQRRDATHVVLRRDAGILVDVDLRDRDLVFVLGRDLVEDRGNHLAGAAPFSPEIEQHGLVGFQDVLAECRITGMHDVRVAHAGKPPVGVREGLEKGGHRVPVFRPAAERRVLMGRQTVTLDR